MNLSETRFILPARDAATERERGVRVRIFTVEEELPFAGHPTLGTAFALRAGNEKEIVLDLNAGKVPVRFEDSPGQPTFGEMTQLDPVFGSVHDRGAVARAIGLREEDFDGELPFNGFNWNALHHHAAQIAGGHAEPHAGPEARCSVCGRHRRKIFLFRDPRNGGPDCTPARAE